MPITMPNLGSISELDKPHAADYEPIVVPTPIIGEANFEGDDQKPVYTALCGKRWCGEKDSILPPDYLAELQALIGSKSIADQPIDMVFTRIAESGLGDPIRQNSARQGFLHYLLSSSSIGGAWRPTFSYISVLHQFVEDCKQSSNILVLGEESSTFAQAYVGHVFPEKNIQISTCAIDDKFTERLATFEKETSAGYDALFCFESISAGLVYSTVLFLGGLIKGRGLVCLPYADTTVAYDPILTNIKALYANNFKLLYSTKNRHLGFLTDYMGITVWRKSKVSALRITGISQTNKPANIGKFGSKKILEEPMTLEFNGPNVINEHEGPFNNILHSSESYRQNFLGYELTHIKNGSIMNPHGVVVSSDQTIHSDFVHRLHRSKEILEKSGILDQEKEIFVAVDESATSINNCIVVIETPSWYFNYWHWSHEYLPRLKSVLENTDDSIPILIPPLFADFQRQSLYSLAGAAERVFSLSCPVIKITDCEVLSFGSTQNCFSSSYQTVRDDLLDRLGRVNRETKPSRKIFLSRAGTTARRITNEADMNDVLAQYEFEVIQPENLSMAEQVKLFWSASHVVGMEGAGLANLMFCQKTARMLAIHTVTSVKDSLCHYATANAVGMDYTIFGCKASKQNWDVPAPDVIIDVDMFEKSLTEWMKG